MTELHVIPDERTTWCVFEAGASSPLSQHTNATDAELAALARADGRDADRVVIHDRYHRTHDAAPSRAEQRVRAQVGAPNRASPDPGTLELADRDQWTGLWNRRRFEMELDRSRQDGERLALLSIDVDGCREVIHRHSARAAEELIRSISHVLAKRLRPNQTLARMGSERFAAVLPGPSPQLVRRLADELCTAVRDQSHATTSSRLHFATISVGAAFFDAGTQTHHEAMLAADSALDEAKAAGGDRAILHETPQGA